MNKVHYLAMSKHVASATLQTVVVVAAVFAAGCQSAMDFVSPPSNPNPVAWRPPLPPSVGPQNTTGNRPLRPDDRVEISIQPPALGQAINTSDTIDALGVVTLPIIGDIRIDKLTTFEAETAIRDAYVKGGIYQDVNVRVLCPEMIQSQRVFVNGSVRRVGPIQYRDGMKLLETIIEAGGLSDYASGSVTVTRGALARSYDLDRIKRGKEENPVLLPGDVIEARESRF